MFLAITNAKEKGVDTREHLHEKKGVAITLGFFPLNT